MRLSIIIPVYNEEATLKDVITRIESVKLPGETDREIVIVNDGSTDGTRRILDHYSASDPVIKVIHSDVNQGKTSALAKGINVASGDLIVIQDADLEYHPEEYGKLIEPIRSGAAQVVYGSRFKGSIKGMTWVNRVSNRFSNFAFNIIYGTRLTDINTCYKVFPNQIIKSLRIESTNFTFETEVTAKLVRRGVKILEVPIDYTARSHHQGKKIRWGTALQMFWGMIRFRRGEM